MFKRVDNWWESLCKGCGMCCYEKDVTDEDLIYIDLESPCKYLEECSKKCRVYEDRLKIHPDCGKVNLWEALFNPYLPGSCGYVEKIRFWKRKKHGR